MSLAGLVPGWYGKLPSVGDFASRRWPDALIEPWDQWLAEGIGTLRHEEPEGWLQGYLNSPTWRFVLGAGVLGAQQPSPLAGVLMPSVDKVGRYFPLSMAAALPRAPMNAAETDALMSWLHQLDDLAADALQQDWTIDELERQLPGCPPPQWKEAPSPLSDALQNLLAGHASLVDLPVQESRHALITALGQGLMGCATAAFGHDPAPAFLLPGLSWWWCEPDARPEHRRVMLGKDLPRGADFARLLGTPTTAE